MLKIVLCCQVDPDTLGYGIPAARFDVYKEKLSWRNIEENVPKIKELCNEVKDYESNHAKITWFIRSDDQLKIIFNDYAYPLRNCWNLWKELKNQGDEIGWHPHLWRWNDEWQCWFQEVSDKEWIERCLEKGHAEFLKINQNLTSVKTGWNFHSNFTMRKVNDLGLTVDLSALPGLQNSGCYDERGSHFLHKVDWSITPEKPFHPSKQDYRRPKRNNEKEHKILEIPLSMFSKNVINIMIERTLSLVPLSLRGKILKGQIIYGTKQIQTKYEANIMHPSFQNAARQKFKEAKQNHTTYLATCFYPIELYEQKAPQILQKNLKALEYLSERLKVPFAFLTATELATQFLYLKLTSKDKR